MGLGKFIGGALGLLIPGVGPAIGAAIGSGLGSLVIDKEDPKDAIKNALIAGAGAALFPGAVGKFQSSALGQTVTGGLASLGLGNMGAYAAQQAAAGGAAAAAPAAVAGAAAPAAAKGGIGGLFGGGAAAGGGGGGLLGGNPLMLYSGLSALGAMEDLQKPDEGFEETYASRYTGVRYATPEERDRAEEAYAMNKLKLEGPRLQAELGQPRSARGYAMGGYIQGPGTGRSDSIPATIYQDGRPVEDARLSDGEFVMTERAVRGAGNGDRDKGAAKMYAMMRQFERGMA